MNLVFNGLIQCASFLWLEPWWHFAALFHGAVLRSILGHFAFGCVCVQSMRLLLVVRLLADWFSFLFFYIVSYTIFSLFLSIHWLFYYYKYLYSERRSELLFRWALVTKCLVTELSTVDESSFAGKSRPVKNATSDIGLESLWREVESRLSYCNIFVLSIRPFS
jgi:predicted membrane protein